MTEVLKAATPSPAKTDSCNPFHKRTQDRTKERENCTVLDLGISKDREWAAKAPRVGLLNTYCAGKRPRTWWSTRLSILKKTIRDATLRLYQRSQLTLPPLNRWVKGLNNNLKFLILYVLIQFLNTNQWMSWVVEPDGSYELTLFLHHCWHFIVFALLKCLLCKF